MRIAAFLLFATLGAAAPQKPIKLTIDPADPLLFGKGSKQTLIATARYADGSEEDVTGSVQFRSEKPAVASINEGWHHHRPD